jgi:hypothetical protein
MATRIFPQWYDVRNGKGVIAATDTYVLGNTGDGTVGTWVIQAVESTFVGSIIVKARLKGSAAAFVPILYKQRNLGGTVSDDTSVSTTLTDQSFLIEVNGAGLDVALDCTAYTSGSLDVYAVPLIG